MTRNRALPEKRLLRHWPSGAILLPHPNRSYRMAATQISVTPRTGRFAGVEVFTNRAGEGIFTRRADGSHQQRTGTSQTPVFCSSAHLAAWLRTNYPDAEQSYRAEQARGR